MTCPVAMSRDAWSYWDTGFLDYLNPNAIRGTASALNPLTCAADNLAGTAFDAASAKEGGEPISAGEGKNRKKTALADLPTNFRGIGACSFPIMGDAEAISSAYLALPGSFAGPWCTIWGPMVPRQSTVHYQSDYAFANTALRFKTLAHDIFGIPRGNKERWTLAYPWESSFDQGIYRKFLAPLKNFMGEKTSAGTQVENSFAPTGSRSETLVVPGDPRMIDASSDDFVGGAKNFAKEAAYLASLYGLSEEAKRRMLRELHHDDEEFATPEQILSKGRTELNEATDASAKLAQEAIFEERGYCHFEREGDGTIIGDSRNTFNVPGRGKLAFIPMGRDQCLSERQGGRCLKRHKISRKCLSRQIHTYIWLGRMEITGYQKVQNPRRFEKSVSCSQSGYRTPNTRQEYVSCEESISEIGRDDTRDYLDKPDPSRPAQIITSDDETAKKFADLAGAGALVGTELARLRYNEMTGSSSLPGKKRVYTIWEEIECRAEDVIGQPLYRKKVGTFWLWNSCQAAVHFEIIKWFQKKLLRKVCDGALDSNLGAPFS